MIEGDGARLTQEFFRVVERIRSAKGISQKDLSVTVPGFKPHRYPNAKQRKRLKDAFRVVESGLALPPSAILGSLTLDIGRHWFMVICETYDQPADGEAIAELSQLTEQIRTAPACQPGEVAKASWEALETLEYQRFQQPQEVEAACRRILRDALTRGDEIGRDEAVIAIGAAGVWSTIRRFANDRGSATQALARAIQAAEFDLKENRLLARLLERATYILCDADECKQAELLAYHAFRLFTRIGDQEGQGRALIDAGFAAYAAREFDEAEAAALSGAELLGTTLLSHINKASAYHLAAKCCSARGELAAATRHLEAAALVSAANEERWASIRWCAGTIQLQMGQLSEAEAALRESLQVMLRHDRVLDIIMLLLDLATVFSAQGRFDSIAPLAEYLEPYLARSPGRSQVRSHMEEAHSCLIRAHVHKEVLERFRESFRRTWPGNLATS